MEECAEVTQCVSKLLQFGPHEYQKDHPQDNEERLRGEILDVMAHIILLDEAGYLRPLEDNELDEWVEKKRAKTEKYRAYSETLGCVEPD